MESSPKIHLPARVSGFTLIEMLVTVSVLAVLLGIAGPNLRVFVIRSSVAGLSNEFNGALTQARALAIANNSCTTICATPDTLTAKPQCDAKATNFNVGWIIFLNRACDATQNDPTLANAAVVASRAPGQANYSIGMSTASLRRVDFSPRGVPLVDDGSFIVTPPDGVGELARIVCLSAAGRTSVRAYSASGC